MTLAAAWSILRRFWWAIPMAGLLLYATVEHRSATRWRAKQAATQAAFDTTVANYRTASAKAIADNIADVRAKESDAANLVEDKQHDLEGQLADARALADDYARRVRAASSAHTGSTGEAGLSPSPGAPGSISGAGPMSIMDEGDLRICSDAVVKARGWQAFYASLRTRYNADGQP